jgi:hypothetical protein|nr:hypothetical protein [uncultured Albidiferax sp.]
MTAVTKAIAPRKRATSSKVPVTGLSPIRVNMLVADEFRQEANGKVFVLGLFPDGVVSVNVPHDIAPIGPDNPLGIERLSLMLVVRGAVGLLNLSVAVRVEPDQPAQNIVKDKVQFSHPDGSTSIILVLEKFLTSSEGEKWVTVKVGDQHTSTHVFEMKRAVKK